MKFFYLIPMIVLLMACNNTQVKEKKVSSQKPTKSNQSLSWGDKIVAKKSDIKGFKDLTKIRETGNYEITKIGGLPPARNMKILDSSVMIEGWAESEKGLIPAAYIRIGEKKYKVMTYQNKDSVNSTKVYFRKEIATSGFKKGENKISVFLVTPDFEGIMYKNENQFYSFQN